jgi:hypothetical protein
MYQKPTLFFFFFCCVQLIKAQILPSSVSIKPQLNQVINDYPSDFSTIKGIMVEGEPNTVQYKSKVEPKGSIESRVIGYPSKEKTYWVWESKLLVTEDINQLKRMYKLYYNDIAGNNVSISTGGRLTPTTSYTSPSDELRLWIQQFKIKEPVGVYENLMVDLIAEYSNYEWTITLRIYGLFKMEEEAIKNN